MTRGTDEHGSGTVLALALAAAVLLLTGLGTAIGTAVVARHRAEAAADLAAIAAVSAGCGHADQVARHNASVVTGCRALADGSMMVEVAVPVSLPVPALPRTARARARAGRPDDAAPAAFPR